MALLVTVSVPDCAPRAVGVKVSPILQVELAANVPELGQVVDGSSANSLFEKASEEIFRATVRLLVRVTVSTALVALSAM